MADRRRDAERGLIFDFPADRRAVTDCTQPLQHLPDPGAGHVSARTSDDSAEADEIERVGARGVRRAEVAARCLANTATR